MHLLNDIIDVTDVWVSFASVTNKPKNSVVIKNTFVSCSHYMSAALRGPSWLSLAHLLIPGPILKFQPLFEYVLLMAEGKGKRTHGNLEWATLYLLT